MGDGYHSQVLNDVADVLMRENYYFVTVHHRHRKNLVETYPRLQQGRGVEGILMIDTRLDTTLAVPTVCMANHSDLAGVSSVILDEDAAAMQSLQHLYKLGHRRIVFIRGQSFSSDSADRWDATIRSARALGPIVRLSGFDGRLDLFVKSLTKLNGLIVIVLYLAHVAAK